MKQQKNTHNIPVIFFELLLKLKVDFNINKILLFGSRARGDFNERSDIDLAILAPSLTSTEWLEVQDRILNNSVSLLKIDLVRLEEIKDLKFKTRIEKEAVQI